MSLKLKLLRTGINPTGTEMYLQDSTGDYIAESNEGGWGPPNPTRNSKALLVEGFVNRSTGSADVEFKEYDPESVESFTTLVKEDGYYEVFMCAVDKVEPAVEGAYGWTVSGGLVQLVDGNIVPKTPKDLYDDPNFEDSVSFKTVIVARMSIYRNTKNLELVRLRMAKHDDRGHNREIDDLEEHFSFVRELLEGAVYMWCTDSYTEAQRIIEAFNELIDE